MLTNLDILPIINHALDSPTHSMVDAALRTLPVVLPILDFSTIKNEIFPVIAAVFAKTSSMGIKIRGLEALKTLCGGGNDELDSFQSDGLTGVVETPKRKNSNVSILDRYTIQEKVVPLLKGIKTKEPAVMIAALDVFKAIGPQIDCDFLAIEVLPVLWQFSLGPLLNLSQFQAYMSLIKSLSARVENDQCRKLQELGANNNTTASASRNDFMSFGGASSTNGLDAANGNGETDFEALVRGGNQHASTGQDMLGGDAWSNTPKSASTSTNLASRQALNRSRASNNASPVFSWSTPPISPPANLSAPQGSSRAITPDQTINSLNSSFPALAPSNPGIGSPAFSQQQARPTTGMGMNSIMSPTIAPSISTPSYTPQNSGVDWSKAASSPSVTPNPWSSTTTTNGLSNFPMASPPAQSQPRQQGNPYSSFSIAPPPTNRSNSAFSIPPPPSSGTSAFGIAPPPSNKATTAGARVNMNSMASRMQNQNQGQAQQKPSEGWGSSDGGSLI
jgi:SCY1-like protein 2